MIDAASIAELEEVWKRKHVGRTKTQRMSLKIMYTTSDQLWVPKTAEEATWRFQDLSNRKVTEQIKIPNF